MMANKALLIIGPQKMFTEEGQVFLCRDAAGTIERINKLIGWFDQRGMPIVYVRHQHREPNASAGLALDVIAGSEGETLGVTERGREIEEYCRDLVLLPDRHEIIKTRYSAFARTNLKRLLDMLKVTQVVISGFTTDRDCESTARQAVDMSYAVDFVVDATGTPGTADLGEDRVRLIVGALLGTCFAKIYETHNYLKM